MVAPRLTIATMVSSELLRPMVSPCQATLSEPFTTVGLCCYRDGSDSVAWHGDTIGRSSSDNSTTPPW
ncbi:hypothetical protein MAHJHV55_52240 [Mycobacterium avium subsp. hominissuis]